MNLFDFSEKISQHIDKVIFFLSENTPPLVAKTIPNYIKKITKGAYSRGYKIGHLTGTDEGYKNGLENGKNIWVIEDHRTATEPRPIDDSIYGPDTFEITDAKRSDMRRAVADAVINGIIDPPTDDQWKMIFSESPATCIIAGAGSGKSTTLVLRVIFMLAHLKIPQHQITVVSFKKAPCDELRHSIIRVLAHWQTKPFTDDEAKKLVRTFHSALYRVAKSVFGGVQFFENVGKKNKSDISEEDDDGDDIDNPFSSSRLNEMQSKLIKDSYIDLFNLNANFRLHVLAMLEIECARDFCGDEPEKKYGKFILEKASKRDEDLVRKVNARWKSEGFWPSENFLEGPVKVFTIEGQPFYANGVIAATRIPVFLGGFAWDDGLFDEQETIADPGGNDTFKIYDALKVKKNIVARYYGGKYLLPNSPRAAERLQWRVKHLDKSREIGDVAPIFDIKLDGEISSAPVYEALFNQASFIESMGLEVSDAIKRMKPFRSECMEYHFCHAISRYWQHFESDLRNKGIITFNHAFLCLSKEGGDRAKPPTKELLQPFTHLLIDEFQDISPQIVAWLKKCQRGIVNTEEKGVMASIMAIGDDWQSIYGWRGSAPDFFIKFDNHFPCHSSIGSASVYPMVENFRSIEAIVRQSEIILKPIKNKTLKICTATRITDQGDHGIKITECGEYNEENLSKIAKFILEQYQFAKSIKKSHKNKVIVMSRRNDILDKIEAKVGNIPGIVFYTYHRAKGLQGEVAIMVEDCIYDQTHKLRNRVYACTGLFSNHFDYDQAQKDEALRLAYVGSTRGRRRVFWFVDSAKGAAKQLMDSGVLEK